MKLPSKAQMKDSGNRPLTQSLFLELGYSDMAVYSLGEDDKEYKGKVYPSLKKLFLEYEDVKEYNFTCEYLLGWNHWKRLCNNKAIRKHINEWREELDLKLRSRAVMDIIAMSAEEKGFQSAKYIADGQYDKAGAGRPKKDTSAKDAKYEQMEQDEYSADIIRLSK